MSPVGLPEDLIAWEKGRLSLTELKRRHPGPEVDEILDVRDRLISIDDAVTPPAWASVQKRLAERPLRPIARLRAAAARPLVIGAAASVLGTSVAAAAGVDPISRGVRAVWRDVTGIFQEGDDGPARSTEEGVPAGEPSTTAGDEVDPEEGASATDPQPSHGSGAAGDDADRKPRGEGGDSRDQREPGRDEASSATDDPSRDAGRDGETTSDDPEAEDDVDPSEQDGDDSETPAESDDDGSEPSDDLEEDEDVDQDLDEDVDEGFDERDQEDVQDLDEEQPEPEQD